MGGQVLNFSESDLTASAAAYDPQLHEAPMVIGHPQHDNPAYGWVKKLSATDGALFAEPDQVDPAFAELVTAGRYKKISASFYAPTSPSNPVPGVYYLRHVGFLGAQPPAVKGLRAVEFADADEGIVEFSEWDDRINAGLWRNLRDWLIGKFGLEEADKAIRSWEVQSLQEAALEPEKTSTGLTAFSEPGATTTEQSQEESTVTPEEAQRLERENATLKTQLKAAELKQRTAEFGEFLNRLVIAGKVLPVEQQNILEFAESLSAEQTLEFSEGDGKKTHTQLEALKTLLSARPVVVNFGETDTAADAVDLTNPHAIKDAANALVKAAEDKGQTLSYAEAVQQVTAAG